MEENERQIFPGAISDMEIEEGQYLTVLEWKDPPKPKNNKGELADEEHGQVMMMIPQGMPGMFHIPQQKPNRYQGEVLYVKAFSYPYLSVINLTDLSKGGNLIILDLRRVQMMELKKEYRLAMQRMNTDGTLTRNTEELVRSWTNQLESALISRPIRLPEQPSTPTEGVQNVSRTMDPNIIYVDNFRGESDVPSSPSDELFDEEDMSEEEIEQLENQFKSFFKKMEEEERKKETGDE